MIGGIMTKTAETYKIIMYAEEVRRNGEIIFLVVSQKNCRRKQINTHPFYVFQTWNFLESLDIFLISSRTEVRISIVSAALQNKILDNSSHQIRLEKFTSTMHARSDFYKNGN